jgi:hypothetical protein
MSTDPRDALWEATFRAYYDVYYSEIVANKLVTRWQIADDITKVLVAVTASTSAVAGWALWEQPEFKIIWTVIAGLGAFLSLTHAALSVTRRLKDWMETGNHFLSLRIELDTLRERMKLDTQFDTAQLTNELMACRNRYAEGKAREPYDFILTSRLESQAQGELDICLKDEIET